MKKYNIDGDTGEVYTCPNGEWVKYKNVYAHISALEAKCGDLEQQLASMTAERDSESRWAKQYCEEADELKRQLKGMRRDELKMSLWEE